MLEESGEMISGNGEEGELSEGKIPKHEAHLTHVEIEVPNYNPVTGARNSRPQKQTFYPQEFEQMKKDNAFAGMRVVVIHDGSLPVNEETLRLNVTPQSGPIDRVDTSLAKPLEEMTDEELVKEYRKYYNEQPLPEYERTDLIQYINEKRDWIEAESKEAADNASLDTGDAANTLANSQRTTTARQARNPRRTSGAE